LRYGKNYKNFALRCRGGEKSSILKGKKQKKSLNLTHIFILKQGMI